MNAEGPMLELIGGAFGIYIALIFLSWLDREHELAGGRVRR